MFKNPFSCVLGVSRMQQLQKQRKNRNNNNNSTNKNPNQPNNVELWTNEGLSSIEGLIERCLFRNISVGVQAPGLCTIKAR